MYDLSRLRKYFIYDDTSKTVVSVTSGIFIVLFNLLSGVITVYIITQLIFGYYNPDVFKILLILIPGVAAGSGFIKLCIFIIDVILTGTEVESYSYIRLILMASVCLYIFILIFYILFMVTSVITDFF